MSKYMTTRGFRIPEGLYGELKKRNEKMSTVLRTLLESYASGDIDLLDRRKEKEVATTFTIQPEIIEKVEERAKREGISMNKLFVTLLAQHINRE